MEDLYEVTHENVQLAVRDQDEVVFVERFAARDAVNVLTKVGGRFAMPPTGVGLVLLAYAPAEVQERVLAGPLVRFTAYTITDPGRLRRVLAEVRRTGFAVSDRQVTDDAVSVAAPIRSGDRVVAALSVVVRGDSAAAVRGLTPTVRAAARGISRVSGIGPLGPHHVGSSRQETAGGIGPPGLRQGTAGGIGTGESHAPESTSSTLASDSRRTARGGRDEPHAQ